MQNPPAANGKLLSLLTLSAGAVALSQNAEGAIFYSGVIDEKVGFSPGFNASYTIDLPGTADLQLIRTTTSPAYNRTVSKVDLRQLNGYGRIRAYSTSGRLFARRNNAGPTWDAIGGLAVNAARIGERSNGNIYGTNIVIGPGAFTDRYIAFEFNDSTAGGAVRYGWADLSMSISTTSGPDVTLKGYAFDDSGAKIQMGAVPEPASAAVAAALGALVYGGVRRWRASKAGR